MLILHSLMLFPLEKFIQYCKIINKPITGTILPKSIAKPLHTASTYLFLTFGMAYGLQYNWLPIHELDYNS